MKTLLITGEYPPFKGGVANYYGSLASLWPIGENLIVLNNNQGELYRASSYPAWWPSLGVLHRKMKNSHVDYVLVGQVLPYGIVVFFLSLFRRFPYAVFLHGLDLTMAMARPRKRFITGLILRRAQKIICANSHVARRVKESYPFLDSGKDKTAVVNPGITSGAPFVRAETLAELRRVHHLEGKIVLLALGRLVRRKGFDMTIRALAGLTEEQLDRHVYLIAGSGPDEGHLKRAVPHALRGKVKFLGEVSDREKWEWLQLADIFIMPARDIAGDYEGFGIVYLEANICGKPVIAGRSGGVGDAVEDGVSGLLVDPENAVDIGETIIRLSVDAGLREKLGQNGRERAAAKFNWEQQVARLLSILKDEL